jgi:hypothetical protein
MTQVELAGKAHVSRSFIIGLERGTNQGAEAGRVFLVLKALGLRLVVEEDTSPTFEEALQDLLTQGLKMMRVAFVLYGKPAGVIIRDGGAMSTGSLRYPRHAMSIGDEAYFGEVGSRKWSKFATTAGLASEEVLMIVNEIATKLPDALRDAIKELPRIGRFVDDGAFGASLATGLRR